MLIAGLNYEMDHQPQNTLVTTVTLLQHLQPTYQQLDSFWSWAQAKEMTKEKLQLCICQHVPLGGAMENIQKSGMELGGLNTTKHILLPYDPGGLALRRDKCGGILDPRMFIIGLRASRISRKESVTPHLWAATICCNLGLGLEMG